MVGAALLSLAVFGKLVLESNKLDELLNMYKVRSQGSTAPVEAMLKSRHVWIQMMFPGLAIVLGKLAVPVILRTLRGAPERPGAVRDLHPADGLLPVRALQAGRRRPHLLAPVLRALFRARDRGARRQPAAPPPPGSRERAPARSRAVPRAPRTLDGRGRHRAAGRGGAAGRSVHDPSGTGERRTLRLDAYQERHRSRRRDPVVAAEPPRPDEKVAFHAAVRRCTGLWVGKCAGTCCCATSRSAALERRRGATRSTADSQTPPS